MTGLVDAAGVTVVNYTYDSWGKLILTDGTMKDTLGVKNTYRYRGYRFDTETGLFYLQSRYYNPDIGRFINADAPNILLLTKGDILHGNTFSYCKNNPVMNYDPSGYFSVSNILPIVFDIAFMALTYTTPVGWYKAGLIALYAGRIAYSLYTIYKANQVLKRNPNDANARYDKYFGFLSIASGIFSVIAILTGSGKISQTLGGIVIQKISYVWGFQFSGSLVIIDLFRLANNGIRPKRRAVY